MTQLAAQLEGAAATQIEAIQAGFASREAASQQARNALEAQIVEANTALETMTSMLDATRQDASRLLEQLSIEQIERHTAEQRSRDLAERVAHAERHQSSLEEMHRRALDALDHYRIAAKEQREQEARRH